jgi:hypothetical protein
MADLPSAVLSERLEETLSGTRLVAAVFLTFEFDPGFFEQEILPLFFGIPLSHAPKVRTIQLEDALRSVPDGITVLYDRNGLIAGERSGGLDYARVPINRKTGVFHPKNAFILVERDATEAEQAKDGAATRRSLVVMTMSANLTRSGWWRNAEVSDIEVVDTDEKSSVAGTIRLMLGRFARGVSVRGGSVSSRPFETIRKFLAQVRNYTQVSRDGILFPQFYDGSDSLIGFLKKKTGKTLMDMKLEIISPYFDERFEGSAIEELVATFQTSEMRVYLPLNESGEALCSDELLEGLPGMRGVTWAKLPRDLLSSGSATGAKPRFVHAKILRFFSQRPMKEVLFVGSVNVTRPAFDARNMETGILYEREDPRKLDWWMEPLDTGYVKVAGVQEDEDRTSDGGTPLMLRYSWTSGAGAAFWDASTVSQMIVVTDAGEAIFEIDALSPSSWVDLDAFRSARLRIALERTAMLGVVMPDGATGRLLVQEEGLHHRPSLLLDLTPAEILKYWTLLTPAQRASFIESRAPGDLAGSEEGAALLARVAETRIETTFFDRFAGIFAAFACLERDIAIATGLGKFREAEYRLFGDKHDSLPRLLGKIAESAEKGEGDPVDHYVTALCARQLVESLERDLPEFMQERAESTAALKEAVTRACTIRSTIAGQVGGDMERFLDWFDTWFLSKASPIKDGAS